MSRPAKPSVDFPLFPHASGKWAKKIDGRLRYFGRWDDPDAALAQYNALLGEQASSPLRNEFDVDTACNTFLAAKEQQMQRGDLSHRTHQEYLRTCRRIIALFGRSTPVRSLRPKHFAAYAAERAKTCNLVAVGNEITRVRTIFHWCKKSGMILEDVEFGPDFRKASAKARRRHKRLAGEKLFTSQGVQLLLDESGVHFRAMIMLGINCGFGNTDCATLPLTAVDLEGGWINYPRPKTEVARRIPLWSETIAALRASLLRRYEPNEAANGLFFVMNDGQSWDNSGNPIAKQFRQLRQWARLPNGGFYWLRHTFATVAGGAKDQVAVNAIMGHVDPTMAETYRERIEDDRLQAVIQHVRTWLIR